MAIDNEVFFDTLHLAFENCEGLDVPVEDINFLNARGITESHSMSNRLSRSWSPTSIYKHAETFILHIPNKQEYKRILEYDDIAQVHYQRNGQSLCWYFVDYQENNNGCDNKNQNVESDENDIRVSISLKDLNTY